MNRSGDNGVNSSVDVVIDQVINFDFLMSIQNSYFKLPDSGAKNMNIFLHLYSLQILGQLDNF